MTKFARIPTGAIGGHIEPVSIEIRTLFEYDIHYMRDYLRAELFMSGEFVHIHARMALSDDDLRLVSDPNGRDVLLSRYREELERLVLRQLADQSWRQQNDQAAKQIADLEKRFNALEERANRPGFFRRCHTRVVELWCEFREKLSSKIAP